MLKLGFEQPSVGSVMDLGLIIDHYTFADVQFLPISGLFGHNMKERMPATMCDWWDGPCLFEALDAVELPERSPNGPFRYLQFVFYHGSHFLLYRMDYPPVILPTRHAVLADLLFHRTCFQLSLCLLHAVI